MAVIEIGFVSAAAVFRRKLSRQEREATLRQFELELQDEEPVLRDDLADQYGSLCDFALKRVINQNRAPLRTLRVEAGYGYAEHDKDWFHLGCEFVVEESECEEAYSFLEEPSVAGDLDRLLASITNEFVERHLSKDLFEEISCAFYLLEEPRKGPTSR